MYDLYNFAAHEQPFTSRASREELNRWDEKGAETAEAMDYRAARQLEAAHRAASMDSLSCQVAARTMVKQTVEMS